MRRWSVRIGAIQGIDLRVHFTFVLILLWAAYQWGVLLQSGLGGALYGVVLTLVLFVCVTLHELGHALTARRYGVATRDIILLPIGGIASLERMPRLPREELMVALAGPAVNLALTIAILPVLLLVVAGQIVLGDGLGDLGFLTLLEPSLLGFVAYLFLANVLLAVFNMIPAFPMDGGRVLRALLALRLPYVRATQIAVQVGRALAILIGLFGVLRFDIFTVLIATFVYTGAGQEFSEVQASALLQRMKVGELLRNDLVSLAPTDLLGKAVNLTLHGFQHHFPVFEGTRLSGVLSQSDLLRNLQASQGNMNMPVGAAMQTQIPRVRPTATLEEVRSVMSESNRRIVAVYDSDRYLGILSGDDLNGALGLLQVIPAQQDLASSAESAPRSQHEPVVS